MMSYKVGTKVESHPIQAVVTDSMVGNMYILDSDPDKDTAKANILLSYGWEDTSRKILPANDPAFKEGTARVPASKQDSPLYKRCSLLAGNLVESFYDFNKGMAFAKPTADFINNVKSTTQVGAYVDWQANPTMGGAFKLSLPGFARQDYDLARQYTVVKDDSMEAFHHVILAGDTCSFYGGWVEGAAMSGVNAACAVLYKLIKDQKRAVPDRIDQFLTPPTFDYNG